jgi:hypothetical protein
MRLEEREAAEEFPFILTLKLIDTGKAMRR